MNPHPLPARSLALLALVAFSLVHPPLALPEEKAETEAAPIVTRDRFIRELERDYDPPPPGARGISVDPPPSVTVTLFFKYDSTELADEGSMRQLQEAGAAFSDPRLAPHRFVVEGHTDSDGDEDYNLKLSQRRAKAVVELLTERYGVPAAMLEAVGKGEYEPVASNETDEGKQQNRRVVFVRK